MPILELTMNRRQKRADFGFGQAHHTFDNPASDFIGARAERTQKNASPIRR
jgi:hypothetical protein